MKPTRPISNPLMTGARNATILILLLTGILPISSSGQTVLLDIDRSTDSIRASSGPNLKTFGHIFLKAGLVVGPDNPGARIKYGPSSEYAIGFRKKYKAGNVYSLGWEIQTNYLIYKLKEEKENTLPDTILHDVERYETGSLRLGIFQRFNFDPGRGNYLGYFFEFGVAGDWNPSFKYIVKDEMLDGSQSKARLKNLPYVNDFGANAFIHIGLNKVILYVSYRMTDFFQSEYDMPELPAITAGLELAAF